MLSQDLAHYAGAINETRDGLDASACCLEPISVNGCDDDGMGKDVKRMYPHSCPIFKTVVTYVCVCLDVHGKRKKKQKTLVLTMLCWGLGGVCDLWLPIMLFSAYIYVCVIIPAWFE